LSRGAGQVVRAQGHEFLIWTQNVEEALAESFQVKVPGILESHSGDTEGLFVFLEKSIEARNIDVAQRIR
jgi:hypothetical protein